MRIGIPIWTSKGGTQVVVNDAYVAYVAAAGYTPILITIYNDILAMADLCDGLLLPGGGDIDPIFYDEDNIASQASDPEKDNFERSILHAFIGLNKPVLGICRGLQLIFREFVRLNPTHIYEEAFTYYQHMPDHSLASELNVARTQPSHSVVALRNVLYGENTHKLTRMFVNSMHHQAICLHRRKGNNDLVIGDITVCAMTKRGVDSKQTEVVVEAMKINTWSTGRVLGVQWHPEELNDYVLLHTLFDINTAVIAAV